MGKYIHLYRWTLGPKVNKALLFLILVADVISPAGLDKKGTVRVPISGSKKGALDKLCRQVICTYVHMADTQQQ